MDSIILASASPRRRELLSQIGIEYEVIPSTKEEVVTSTVPYEIVMELAKQKAEDIAIKSGKIDIGKKFKTPASRHTVRNCLMQFGHGAVTLGSEMAGGVRELTVSQCVFRETDRGLRIKTRRGRGRDAVIDGVCFENLRMEKVKTPIVINMWYNCCDPDGSSEYVWSRDRLPVDERTPMLGAFIFRDMECLDCEAAACYCDGLPEMPIGSITIDRARFTYAADAKPAMPAMREFMEEFYKVGMYFDNVQSLTVRDVSVEGCIGEPIIPKNVERLELTGLSSDGK